MKVLFVLALALVQGLAVEFSNLPAPVEISNLPSEIEGQDGIEISNLPSEIDLPNKIEISHLPAEIDLPNKIEINNLPAEIDLPSHIEISQLPADLGADDATPNCVKYVRTLLLEVLTALPGTVDAVERPSAPVIQAPVEGSACTRCFQDLQLLIEKANSRNSASLTF